MIVVDWAAPNLDLLVYIAKRLNCNEDLVKFCAVCKSWQLVTSVLGTELTLPPRSPYVMLTDVAEKNIPKLAVTGGPGGMLVKEFKKNEQIDGMNKRFFYSFSTLKTYKIELPEATRRKCLGLGYGWLLTIGYDLQINLLHPFTRKQLGMPPFLSFKWDWTDRDFFEPDQSVYLFVNKAVMSSNPFGSSCQDCIILVTYSPKGKLAFARPGDEIWTHLNSETDIKFTDVIFFKGNFYAVDSEGHVYVCVINDENNLKVTKIACTPIGSGTKYLVESSGSLLVVVRHIRVDSAELQEVLIDEEDDIDDDDNQEGLTDDEEDIDDVEHDPTFDTVGFSIFKLEEMISDDKSFHEYLYKLRKIDNLGDQSLFLGMNASTSLASSKGIKPNCIYYSEDDAMHYSREPYGGGYNTGRFDVESNSLTLHYASQFRSHLTPPLWLI